VTKPIILHKVQILISETVLIDHCKQLTSITSTWHGWPLDLC